MKTKFFTLFLALLACIGIISAATDNGTCGTNLKWSLDTSTGILKITGLGTMNSWSSPSDVPWYSYRSSIKSITIGNSVTSIGDWAFYGCKGLTSVTIPNSVTSIGNNAFRNCAGLTSVTIPNSVTSIGSYAFYGCTGLGSVTIPNSVTSIGEYAFSNCNSLTSITIPNSVTSIGSGAFNNCKGLTKVEIRSSTILGQTFTETSNMKNIFGSQVEEYIIGEGVTSIGNGAFGNGAFSNCDGLTSVTISNSVTSIGSYAFKDCTALTSVTIGNSVTSIGNNAFERCTGLTSVTIPNSVTSIGEGAFGNCTGLTSIVIPNSVTSIWAWAFYDCAKLAKVEIRSSTILGQTFTETSSMEIIFGSQVEEYIIGEGVTSIGSYAFYFCSRLTSVTIPNSVTSIGNNAFERCTGLTSVTIPNSVTSIGNNAFERCTGLTSVTIPNSVTSIGSYAFYCCKGLTSPVYNAHVFAYMPTSCSGAYTIPNGIESIAGGAFYDCSGLTSITIPNSVTSIGSYAFEDCTALTSVTCEATIPPTYGKSAFSSKKFPLYVPSNSVSAYKTANEWRDFLIIRAIGSDTTFTCAEASETAFRYAINGNSSAKVSIVGYVTNIAEEWSYRYANISFWMADTKGGGKVFEAFRVKCDRQEEAPVVGDKVKVYGCLTVYDEKIPEIAAGGTFEILERADGVPVQADEINNNEVKATPTDDGSVVITWPEVEGATSYTIDIRKKGELICTLVFNSNGQLISIKFAAPSCNGNRRDVAAATQAKKGWSYTITGMESGATYTYSVTAKNDSGTKLFEQSIEYTMPAVQGIVDIDASANQCGIHKFIKNGQLYIQRGNELFNAQGARVK